MNNLKLFPSGATLREDKKKVSLSMDRLKKEPLLFSVIGMTFVLLFVFILYPLGMVFKTSLFPHGTFDISSFKEVFFSRHTLAPLLNSLKLGAAVAILGTFIGYTFAYIVIMTSVPFKRFFKIVATFPIISPPFIIALAAIMILGQNGLLTKLIIDPLLGKHAFNIYGFWGLLLVETISYFPTAFLLMIGIFSSIDPVLEEAALNQGANPFQVFKDVIFPLTKPGIYSSLLLIFIESLADFGNPLILSGNFRVLSVSAYLKITGEYDLPGGAGLAIVLLIPCMIAFFIQKYHVDKKSFVTTTGKPTTSTHKNTPLPTRLCLLGICLLLTSVVFLLYGTVIYGSLVQVWGVSNTLTLDNYRVAMDEGFNYISDSLMLATLATPITGLFGMLIAFFVVRQKFIGNSAMEVISMLTFAVPGTVVGIGYILAFNQRPLLLTGTASIIVILFVFRNMPVGIRSAIAALKQVDPSIEEASANLGAGPFTTFSKIVLPLISPAFFSGLAYSFVRCMTAVSAVIFVVSGQWNLLTISILGYVENSYLSTASAMCILLVIMVSVALGVMQVAVKQLGASR